MSFLTCAPNEDSNHITKKTKKQKKKKNKKKKKKKKKNNNKKTPIQIYWKFNHQNWKFSDKNSDIFHISAKT